MIPTILTETGSGGSARSAAQSAQPDGEGAQAFGDVFALSETPEVDPAVRDGGLADGVPDFALTAPDDRLPSQSVALPAAQATPDLPVAPQIETRAKHVPLADGQEPFPTQPPDSEMSGAQTGSADVSIEKTAVTRSSVAQSVVEGRLPIPASRPTAAGIDLTQSKAIDLTKSAAATLPVGDVAQPAKSMQTNPDTQVLAAAKTALPAAQSGLMNKPNLDALVARPESGKDSKERQAQDRQSHQSPAASAPATPTPAFGPINAQTIPVVVGKQMAQTEPVKTVIDGEVPIALGGAERGQTTQHAANPIPVPTTAETARSAAQQIAVSVLHTPGKATEIALNPEELGRVRLSLTAVDGQIMLTVLADRPETQELLRRHLDMLAQEFRDLGYKSISFSFGRDGQSGAPSEHGRHGQDSIADPTDPDATALRPQPAPQSGLDLRI